MFLDASHLTFIYFTTFEKKRKSQVSPTHTTKLFGFLVRIYIYDAYARICVLSNANFNVPYLNL